MWLQQAKSNSQEWDLPRKTKRAVERDALLAIRIAWAMMSCSLVKERLIYIVDLEDKDLAKTEDIDGLDSVLATTIVYLLRH